MLFMYRYVGWIWNALRIIIINVRASKDVFHKCELFFTLLIFFFINDSVGIFWKHYGFLYSPIKMIFIRFINKWKGYYVNFILYPNSQTSNCIVHQVVGLKALLCDIYVRILQQKGGRLSVKESRFLLIFH